MVPANVPGTRRFHRDGEEGRVIQKPEESGFGIQEGFDEHWVQGRFGPDLRKPCLQRRPTGGGPELHVAPRLCRRLVALRTVTARDDEQGAVMNQRAGLHSRANGVAEAQPATFEARLNGKASTERVKLCGRPR